MLTEPIIGYRDERPCVAIRTEVAMREIPSVLPALHPEVYAWLAKNNIQPGGPPFFKYLSCRHDGKMVIEAGVPLSRPVSGEDRIIAGFFPAGRYAKVTYLGNYDRLKDAHIFLETWGAQHGLQWKERNLDNGIEWEARTEWYVNDCNEEPDPEKWQTDVEFLLEG